jgi:hypothetical protein
LTIRRSSVVLPCLMESAVGIITRNDQSIVDNPYKLTTPQLFLYDVLRA